MNYESTGYFLQLQHTKAVRHSVINIDLYIQ